MNLTITERKEEKDKVFAESNVPKVLVPRPIFFKPMNNSQRKYLNCTVLCNENLEKTDLDECEEKSKECRASRISFKEKLEPYMQTSSKTNQTFSHEKLQRIPQEQSGLKENSLIENKNLKNAVKGHSKLEDTVNDLVKILPKKSRNTSVNNCHSTKIRTSKTDQVKDLSRLKTTLRDNLFFKQRIAHELSTLLDKYNPKNMAMTFPSFLNLIADFGMIREQKEKKLARNLYIAITSKQEPNNQIKEMLLSILNMKESKTFNTEFQRQFESFSLNKFLQLSKKRHTGRSSIATGSGQLNKSAKSLKQFNLSCNSKNKRDKCLSLYNLSKVKKKRPEKSNEEIEYEKSKSELKFTPAITT